MTTKSEVMHGTLDLLVLRTLDALGPQHGYANPFALPLLACRLKITGHGDTGTQCV